MNKINPPNLNILKLKEEFDDNLINCHIGFIIEVGDTGIGI